MSPPSMSRDETRAWAWRGHRGVQAHTWTDFRPAPQVDQASRRESPDMKQGTVPLGQSDEKRPGDRKRKARVTEGSFPSSRGFVPLFCHTRINAVTQSDLGQASFHHLNNRGQPRSLINALEKLQKSKGSKSIVLSS